MKITIKSVGLAIFDGVAMRHGKAVMVILLMLIIKILIKVRKIVKNQANIEY
jgi:hypothetical protein